ncbi:MAG: EamA family transporter [Candidatus Methanoperedens sp.]|nr:EamA family transporter [Candidatus Methanoperedens sp.]
MKCLNRITFSGYGEIITASVLWGLAGILAKMITGMPAQGIIFYRVAFASIIFFIVLLISGNLNLIKLGDKKMYLLLFAVLQAATMMAYFVSILNASVSVAVLLLYTAPVYVTLFSPWLLKESSTKKGIIALVLSFAGVILIVDPGKLEFSRYSIGILAGIISGIAYAFQIMTSKYLSLRYSGYAQAFWGFVIAMLILFPVGMMPMDVVIRNMNYIVLLAIFPTILAVSLYFNGLKKVRAQSASILGLIEPVSAVILAVLILGEQISTPELIGGALILIGAALVMKEK